LIVGIEIDLERSRETLMNPQDTKQQQDKVDKELTWEQICTQVNHPRFIPENKTIFGVKRTQLIQEQRKRNKDAK